MLNLSAKRKKKYKREKSEQFNRRQQIQGNYSKDQTSTNMIK